MSDDVFQEEKMNKRLLCLLLSFVMLVSVMLTGCSSNENELQNIAEAAARNTMTLSMYLMSEKEVSEDQVEKIENAVNQITKARFKVQLDLRYFTEDEYYEAVEAAFKKTKEDKDAKAAAEKAEKEALKNEGKTVAKTSEEVTEEATIINEYGIPELAYPTIKDSQVDIFYLGGYDKFSEYSGKSWLSALDDPLSSDAQIITDYVSDIYLTYLKELSMGATYMIPSNAPAGEYTYMLVNKDILAKYDYATTEGFSSLVCDNVKDILANVSLYDKDYLPLYSSTGEIDALNVSYFGTDANGTITYDFSVLGGTVDPTWGYMENSHYYDYHNIFANVSFKNQITALTEYRINGYYGTEADANKPFAVGYVKGSAELKELYSDDYEVIVLDTPKISTEELYANGFAVSTYATDVSRCMDIITYLSTNVDFRNLLLYGIEGENYEIIEEELDGVIYKMVNRLNENYVMDVNKTGNVTIAYPMVGELPNIREYQKLQNRDTTPKLDLGFALDVVMEPINKEAMAELAELSLELKEKMLACKSIEELDAFFTEASALVANNDSYKIMSDTEYNKYSPNYNAEANGEGCGFAYIYKTWLDNNKLWPTE